MQELLKSKARRVELAMALILFLIEGLIYLTFRTTELNMFRVYGHYEWVESLRAWGDTVRGDIPRWIRFSLPDGLWLFSYLLLVDAIWNKFDRSSFIWYLLMPGVAFGSEILQFVMMESTTPWNTGTYDVMDFVCYGVAVILILIIYFLKFRIRKQRDKYAKEIH